MSSTLVFYDIPSTVPGKAWTPNTWKIRFVLNYKGIPYKTVWLEYPDIARVCKELGAAPTSTKTNGCPYYTLPVIYDPATATALSESAAIARYLDTAFPDTPRVVSAGTGSLLTAFQAAFAQTAQLPLQPIMLPASNARLTPPSEEYFRSTREAIFGKLEEWSPPGPVREGHWAALRAGFGTVAKWMAEGEREGLFFMGNTVCYADFTVAGWLVWVKRVLGPDSPEWAEIQTWDDGKWGRFMKWFEQYEVVV